MDFKAAWDQKQVPTCTGFKEEPSGECELNWCSKKKSTLMIGDFQSYGELPHEQKLSVILRTPEVLWWQNTLSNVDMHINI